MLARLFTGFMVVILTFSFGLVIYRLPLLRARNELDSWVSREAAFLVNNWILLFAAFFVLFATMFPTLSEAVTGERLTVGRAVLQQVDGADRPHPAVPDRRRPAARVAQVDAREPPRLSSCGRRSAAVVTGGALVGARRPRLGVGPLLRAVRVRRRHDRAGVLARRAASAARNTGTDVFTALVGLVGRNKRRYGGYIVHLGIVLIFLGFAGNALQARRAGAAEAGPADDDRQVHGRRATASRCSDDGQKQMMTAYIVGVRGRQADRRRCIRRKWVYPPARGGADDRGRDPPRARRRTSTSVLGGFDLAEQTVTLQIVVNPLVNWIWFGFGVMALGTGIALLPERAFAFALAKLPAEAAATTVALLLLVLLVGRHDAVGAGGMARRRQHAHVVLRAHAVREADAARDRLHLRRVRPPDARRVPQGPVRRLARDARRARGADRSGQDPRRDHPGVRREVRQPRRCSARRSTRASTGWRGCSRTWSARRAPSRSASPRVRWTRQADDDAGAAAAPIDPALDERLDDELRDLD